MESFTLADSRQWFAAAIYFFTLYFALDTPLSRALAVAASVTICWAFSFGRNWIMNAGIALMLIGFAVTLGWIPPPANWPSITVVKLAHSPLIGL